MDTTAAPGPREAHASCRPAVLALDALVAALAMALLWPLLTGGGLPLARDLVFVPQQPMRAEWLGVGGGAARAVPLDAVVAVIDNLVPASVLARVLLVAAILLPGLAAHRAVAVLGWPARVVAGVAATWNPYVVERLAMGQWALLLAYAALWWVVLRSRVVRERGRGLPVAGWLVLGSLTPSGALLTGAGAVAMCWRSRARWSVLAMAVLTQLPWLIPTVLTGAGASADPAGVAAFAPRAERPGGPLWSLLGLGGIWDAGSAPASRGGLLGHLTSVLVLAVFALALLRRKRGKVARGDRDAGSWPGVAALGIVGLVVASLPALPGGERLLAAGMDVVPGLGLLRDSQKWLAPSVVLVVLLATRVVSALDAWCGRRAPGLAPTVALVAAALPVVLLPDATSVTWPTVRPVTYPADLLAATSAVEPGACRVVTLPWRQYRRFSWAGPLTASDPVLRLAPAPVVVDDSLQVGGVRVGGEDPRARAVGAALGRPAAERADALARAGVRWVILYRDDPAVADASVPGASVMREGAHVRLLEMPGARCPAPEDCAALGLGVLEVAALLGLVGIGACRPLRPPGPATLRRA